MMDIHVDGDEFSEDRKLLLIKQSSFVSKNLTILFLRRSKDQRESN